MEEATLNRSTGWLDGCMEEAVSRRSDHRLAGGGV